MPRISLTSFVDFTVATGPSKLTVVSRVKRQYAADYLPSQDFYSHLREETVDLLKRGRPKSELGRSLDLARPDRRPHYQPCLAGLSRWMGRKTLEWLDPVSADWSAADLDVRVNPELHLLVNGEPHVIKMYFKAEPVSKPRCLAMLHLIETTCANGRGTPAILDLRRAKLHSGVPTQPNLNLYLLAEAQQFMTYWNGLP